MPPQLLQRVANPRIREDQALQEFDSSSDTMHRATSEETISHKHGLITADLPSHNL